MLKNLLQLLLSLFFSKKETATIGTQAMPADQYSILVENRTLTSWDDTISGIAPADGYLRLSARSTSSDASLNLHSAHLFQSLLYSAVGASHGVVLPIAKGQTWIIRGNGSENILLHFSETIGYWGGGV